MNKKRCVLSGSDRMKANGKKPSQLWYTPEQYEVVKEAAKIVRRSMTNFAIQATVVEARRFLGQHGWTITDGKLCPPASE